MNEKTLAFVDFVRHNPDAMESIGSLRRGIEILDALAQSNPIPHLVPMTQHSLFGDGLLLHLKNLASGTKDAQDFYLAVVELLPGSIGFTWEPETIIQVLAQADFRYLVERCPEILAENHPLRGQLNLDSYWERRVRRYLVRSDYRRTWDELNKARRGFAKTTDARPDTVSYAQRHENIGEVIFEGQKAYACSKEMLVKLIGDLFSAMVMEKFITPIAETDKTLAGKKMPRRVFEISPTKGGRKIRSYDLQGCTVSGFGFACIFRLQAGYMYPSHSGSGRTPKLHIFDDTGAQVLKIAGYFAKQKDDLRKKRHEDAVERQMSTSEKTS